MSFIDDTLARERPTSLRELTLPRRQDYYPSPVDWRNEVLYFLLVDRFSDGREDARALLDRTKLAAARPNAPDGNAWRFDRWVESGRRRWQGGTLEGARSKLDYLKDLGVTTLWLSPVLKQRGHLDTYHGYGVQDFLDVDPRFGTRADLVRLVADAHAADLRILLDIIFNHSGANWLYPGGQIRLGYTPGRHPFGTWRDPDGHPASNGIIGPEDGVWPQELQDPDTYTRAGTGSLSDNAIDDPNAEHKRTDFEDLRDFNLDHRRPQPPSDSVLGELAACYKYWIALTDCDGFRIDTLKHVTPEQSRAFCGTIKEFAANLGKENFFLVGEIAGGDFNADRYLDVAERNLNAALDIGEMRPTLTAIAKGFLHPGDYFRGFDPADRGMGSHRVVGNRHVSILDDHDHVFGRKLRFSVDALPAETQVVAGVAIQLFTLGIPCLYYGTEQALSGPEASVRSFLPDWGSNDAYLREALFGPDHPRLEGRSSLNLTATDPNLPGFGPFGTAGRHVFDPSHPAYRRIAILAEVRRNFPALRHGRQYLRPISLFGGPFEVRGGGELVAWSRILDDEEVVCIINVNGSAARGADVLVDADLNGGSGATMTVIANTAVVAGTQGPIAHPLGSHLPVRRSASGATFVEARGLPPAEVIVLTNRP
jgi:glycosidase